MRRFITFGSNNMATRVLAFLLQHLMIMCKHSNNLHCIMPSYKEVHLGLVWTRMNYTCVGLVNLGTQSKLLLQLPPRPQPLVFSLEYHIWKVRKCFNQLNARQIFHLSIELHKFWFYHDDLLRCVGGTNKKYALDRPTLPSLWHVQARTNLIQIEVVAFEEANFLLSEKPICPLLIRLEMTILHL